jgi:hypothetical protein
MRGQGGLFDVEERLKELSAKGDDLERLNAIVDFELFRADLARAVPRSDGSMGGRPAFDHVFMFKVLILQAAHGLSDERVEYPIKDRLSFMRFLGLGLADAVPDANTISTFPEALTRVRIDGQPAIEVLFRAYEAALTKAGFLAMGGQDHRRFHRGGRGTPRWGATCLRPPEGTDGSCRANHRHRQSDREDRPRQHRLQHEATRSPPP